MTVTPDDMTEEERTTASRRIDVDKRGTKTMTRHRMGYRGTLTFNNLSNAPLVITASDGAPFEVQGCGDPVGTFSVPAGQETSVRIHGTYSAEEFYYSARIEGTEAEDPIIIIDRR